MSGMRSEKMPDGWFFGTQGGGTARYDEQGQCRFEEPPSWMPEAKGQLVPPEWGLVGPFKADGSHVTSDDLTNAMYDTLDNDWPSEDPNLEFGRYSE